MSISSADICAAADALLGFVGFNEKTGQHIVRFSEDAFGLDVPGERITPTSEFVWAPLPDGLMRLSRERLRLLVAQNIDDRLQLGEALHLYLRRGDLREIHAERRALPKSPC